MTQDEAFNLIRDLEERAIESETETEADFYIELANEVEHCYCVYVGRWPA